jgi:hypothetical protein
MTDRYAHLREHKWREVAHALTRGSPQRFAYVRTELEYRVLWVDH